MREKTAELLFLIEKARKRSNTKGALLEVTLKVLDIDDKNPGLRVRANIHGYENSPLLDENFRLYKTNPLNHRKAIRNAEAVALEAWIYFASQNVKCHVKHYPIELIARKPF